MDRLHRYLWLLLETGARSEALRTLTWDQVELGAGLMKLNPWGRHQTTKRRPTIPISDDLMPILVRAKEEATGPWVLDHDGQIRMSMERFCERHRLDGVTAHTFRHALATRLAQAGVSMPEIAAMLGDTMATIEKNYLHLSPTFLRGALAKLKAA
jgi:integrase